MVPHTYPTIEGRLVLGVITDITGLNEWQDYIPVVAQTNPVASSRNTFANDGYMGVNVLSSLTGLNAWIDYIPCYVVTGRSSPFSVSPDGYISVSAEVGTLGLTPLFEWIGTNSLEAAIGTDPTFTRSTSATVEDFEGLIRTVKINESRFQGARRVGNYIGNSEDLSASSWLTIPSVILTSGHTDPLGGTTAFRLGSSNNQAYILDQQTPSEIPVGAKTLSSIWIKRVTGTGLIQCYSAKSGGNRQTITGVTTEWKRFVLNPEVKSTSNSLFGPVIHVTGDEIDIWHPQVEIISGQANQNPSEYVSTGTASATATNLIEGVQASDFSLSANNFATDQADGSIKFTKTTGGDGVGATLTFSAYGVPTTPNVEYEISGKAKVSSGSSVLVEVIYEVGAWTKTITGTDYVDFSIVVQAQGNNNLGIRTNHMAAGEEIFLKDLSFKIAEHGANRDGVQYFNTLNGNTVTGNVVTEADGSPLTNANTQFGELDGGAGDYFSTPNVVTTWPELDIRVRCAVLGDGTENNLVTKDGGGGRQFILVGKGNGYLGFTHFTTAGGSFVVTSSLSLPQFTTGERVWIRATLDTTTGDTKFYTADGNLETPTTSDYVQLGTTQNSSGATTIRVTNELFRVGASGYGNPTPGKFYRAQVYNEIDGTTPVVDFDFGDYVSGSTWVGIPKGPELWTNPAQTLQGPWVSAGSGVYTIDGSQSGTVGVIDDDFVVIGKSYSITYTVSNRSAGGVTGQVGSVSGNTNSSDGTYTDIIVATATNKPRVNANSSFIGTVSNISVKENQIFTLEGNASVFQPPVDAKGPFGYLAEKAVTNLVTYSQDFTDSSWVKGNTATLALDSVGPDGQANSAVKLIDSNDSGTGSVIAYTNLTLATTTAHTFSCYLKADQLSWGYLRVAGYATLPNGGAYFDLSSGTVGTVEDAAYSATIQDVGNGWYRCALSFTTEADGTGRLDIFVAQDDLDPNVARDGTSSILIYGAQMEVNTFPTSYIATTGAAVTRNGDLLTVPGGIISPSEASISLEASSGHNVNGGTAHTLFSFNGAFRMYAYSASGSGYYPVNSTPMTVTGASRYNTAVRSTLTYKGDDVALYHGDASVAGNFGSTPIIVSNTPTLGAYNSGNQPGYSFRNVKIFDKELTEDQVGDL